nr:uncharacterized protein LOC128692799 [Cherax quadricarinatus]
MLSIPTEAQGNCEIPFLLRGTWFSFEKGHNTITDIDDTTMSGFGQCVAIKVYRNDYKALLFRSSDCFFCVRFHIRTVNVLEKSATDAQQHIPVVRDNKPSLDEACAELDRNQGLITMFNENYVPKNCRSAIEGVWQFAYQNRFSFTGECNSPEAKIQSCQEPGNQFLIANQKFNISFKKCEGIKESFTGIKEFSCLGDWFIGKNHFFAVANTKESRKDEKYRCFVRNRDDDLYMGHSITPECSVLKTPENSPFRFRMTPVKQETVNAGCLLPKNFSGEWMNTAHTEADVFINQTHIIETTYPDEGRFRRTIYVCREQRDNRYMMARLNIDGCQKDYVCFEFVPRHHNIIRFRKGLEMIREDFSTVCSYLQFKSGREWRYDLLLAKDPVAVKCPVAGKFNFTQKGELLFETRILGGVTKSPWDNISCRENISDLSVCDTDQKEIWIDAHYCISVDAYGRHIDIYTDPDYKLKCAGYWKENLRSYLITYDELDPYSKYRCWVSTGLAEYRCWVSTGLAEYRCWVGTGLAEYRCWEIQDDRCPMHFDDGSNPWKEPGASVHVFQFTAGTDIFSASFLTTLIAVFISWLLSLKT